MSVNGDLDTLLDQAETLARQAPGLIDGAADAVEQALANVRAQVAAGAMARPEDVAGLRGAVEAAGQAFKAAASLGIARALQGLAETLRNMGFYFLPDPGPGPGRGVGGAPPDRFDDDRGHRRLDQAGDPTTDPW